jgi:hypothetical protein
LDGDTNQPGIDVDPVAGLPVLELVELLLAIEQHFDLSEIRRRVKDAKPTRKCCLGVRRNGKAAAEGQCHRPRTRQAQQAPPGLSSCLDFHHSSFIHCHPAHPSSAPFAKANNCPAKSQGSGHIDWGQYACRLTLHIESVVAAHRSADTTAMERGDGLLKDTCFS